MIKKTIDFEQFSNALEHAVEEAFRINLANYGTWSMFQEWKRFAWECLDKRKKWHKEPVNKKPEPHICPVYKSSFKVFGRQFYTKEDIK